jgi:hypothetical protein
MSNLLKTSINISGLRSGMTVEVGGELLTVSKKDIRYNSFMGYSFRGNASNKTIMQVQFIVPTNRGVILN